MQLTVIISYQHISQHFTGIQCHEKDDNNKIRKSPTNS